MHKPWLDLPRVEGPVSLLDAPDAPAGDTLDALFDLPAGSSLTVARVDPVTGTLHTRRWRHTGDLGFYPASTIKWITAALAVTWMDEHRLEADDVLALGDEPARTLRDLVLDMLVLSDNAAFNVLQETVGFAETHQALRGWGATHGLIRRHFTRPHWNHSRAIRVFRQGEVVCDLPPRPAVDLPLNTDTRPAPLGNPEANYFTADDFVRVGAATLMGPTRDARHFDLFTQGLGWTNQCYVREGLTRLTASQPASAFVVLNKPGWWPPDGANSELCYIFDVAGGRHYLLAVYVQGTQDEAKAGMSQAAEAVFTAIRDGRLLAEASG